jgi:hypothetical protein
VSSIKHFYHLYIDGDAAWEPIALEYAQALEVANFPVTPSVGLVGKDRGNAKQWLARQGWPVVAEADTGFEQVTITALQAELGWPDDAAVLYAHSKGAWRNMPNEDQWRRSMLWHLVIGWRNCVELLSTCQVVGCHWMGNHFAGNFWWAQAGYLRSLPPVYGITEAERGQAETWIGLGEPTVANLVAGFASSENTEAGALAISELLPMRHVRRRAIWGAIE